MLHDYDKLRVCSFEGLAECQATQLTNIKKFINFLSDYPNSCYISSTGQAQAIGSEWQMENACGRVSCEGSESGDLFVHYAT